MNHVFYEPKEEANLLFHLVHTPGGIIYSLTTIGMSPERCGNLENIFGVYWNNLKVLNLTTILQVSRALEHSADNIERSRNSI
jgi:hypothetical protein